MGYRVGRRLAKALPSARALVARSGPVILSDRSIREALASGRIVIEPLAEDALQPASVDIRLDRQFRVFRNHRDSYIDVRESTEGLTELEAIEDDEPFVLHPGRVRSRLHPGARYACRRHRRACRRQIITRTTRNSGARDGRIRRCRLGRPPDDGTLERREPADPALLRDEDRSARVPRTHDRLGAALRLA